MAPAGRDQLMGRRSQVDGKETWPDNGWYADDYELYNAATSPRRDYVSKYGKFAYRTHFPFNVTPAAGSCAPDAMLPLTHDGRAFGHRGETCNASAAPGMM